MFKKNRTIVALCLSALWLGCSDSDSEKTVSYTDQPVVSTTDVSNSRYGDLPARTTYHKQQVVADTWIRHDRTADAPSNIRRARYESDGAVRRVPVVRGPQHDLTLEAFRRHVNEGTAVVVDARSSQSFTQGHVRGAINIPASQKESYRELGMTGVDPNKLIIVYCSDPSCESSDMLYEYFLAEGFTNIRVFTPGWAALLTASGLR